MLFPRALLLTGLAPWSAVAQESGRDLGAVLADNDNLSTFYDLIQVRYLPWLPCMRSNSILTKHEQKYPDILLQLPSYDGVTVSLSLTLSQI